MPRKQYLDSLIDFHVELRTFSLLEGTFCRILAAVGRMIDPALLLRSVRTPERGRENAVGSVRINRYRWDAWAIA